MRQRLASTLALGTAMFVAACNNDSTPPALTQANIITQDLVQQTGTDASKNVATVANAETTTGLNLEIAPNAASYVIAAPGAGWSKSCAGPDAQGWYTCTQGKEDDNLTVTRQHRFWKEGAPVPISGTPYDSIQYRWSEIGVDSADGEHRSSDAVQMVRWINRTDTSSVAFNRVSTPNQRIWNWKGQRSDSSLVTGSRGTRFHRITGSRVGTNVTWNVPRSTNPYPVSGTLTHTWNATVIFTAAGATKADTVQRSGTTTITFDGTQTPKITVGGLNCTIDLKTHKTSNCS